MSENKGKSFVTIMVVIAVSALVLRIVIDKIIKANIAQNESQTAVTIKRIAAALENYAKDNNDKFPADFSLLLQPRPPYLDKNYILQSPFNGYVYACPRVEVSGYTCYASPTWCQVTGKAIYTVTTGGVFVSEECKIKE